MSHRKLIRPKLSDVRTRRKKPSSKPTQRSQQSRKSTPPEQTFAEIYYYLKQMHARTPMVVMLHDGEELRGWIEWYDKEAIKLNRENKPNLLILKSSIKYMYKESELLGKDEEPDREDLDVEAETGEEEGPSEPDESPPKKTTRRKKQA